jgi:hypothetical protein
LRLLAREHFIQFSRRERCKLYEYGCSCAGAGEASADVPGGGESDGAIEDLKDKLGNTRMNGEEIDLDGEHGNRTVFNFLFVCEICFP